MRWLALLAVAICNSGWCATSDVVMRSMLRYPGSLKQLLSNTGFENTSRGTAVGWRPYEQGYALALGEGRSGSSAIVCTNSTGTGRFGAYQVLQLNRKTPAPLLVTGWSKAENVSGSPSPDYSIYVDIIYTDGTPLWGQTGNFSTGTHGWERRSFIIAPSKPVATVYVYALFRNIKGRVWFDDIEVREWLAPPMRTMLLDPNYRGLVRPDQKLIQAVASLELADHDLTPADVVVRTDLIRASDGAIVDRRRFIPSGQEVYVEIPVAGPFRAAGYGGKNGCDWWLLTDGCTRPWPCGEVFTPGPLAPGSYRLRLTLERAGTLAPLGSDEWRLRVPTESEWKSLPSHIDEANRLIVDGHPFFPLGMYWGGVSEADLKTYADSAFNCLMPYGAPTAEQMDMIAKHGLKVIYSVKDIYVGTTWCPKDIKTEQDERAFIEAKAKAFRSHPALLGWYLNDELPLEYMPRLEAHQQWLEELDPGHPTWVVLYQVGQLEQYRKTFDVLGTDPYPIPGPARRAADWTRQSVASVMNRRPIWMVPQVFNHACYAKTEAEKRSKRPPTLPEMRSMAWQCIVEGAKGLIFYSFFDIKRDVVVPFEQQWPLVKQVAAEIKRMIPAILSVEPAPQATVTGKREWLHFTTRRLGDRVYLMGVNDEEKAHKAIFRLSSPFSSDPSSTPSQICLVLGEGKWRTLPGAGIEADFAPHGVMIFELKW